MNATVTVYEGPGKARKVCPSGHYVHARTGVCVCGHEFREGAKAEQDAKNAPSVYTEPGQGRKHCINCDKYVGVKNRSCPACGAEFTSKQEPKPANTFSEGGKGRKECPGCKQYVGARTLECECGFDFTKPTIAYTQVVTKVEPAQEVLDAPALRFKDILGYPKHITTIIPSGECPTKLRFTDEKSVIEWIDAVQKHYINKGEVLAPEGFVYFAGHFYNVFSANHKQIKSIIRDYFNSILGGRCELSA